MIIYVVYEVRYGVSHWSDKEAMPIAAFTTMQSANKFKAEKTKKSRNYYHRVKKLYVEI